MYLLMIYPKYNTYEWNMLNVKTEICRQSKMANYFREIALVFSIAISIKESINIRVVPLCIDVKAEEEWLRKYS